MVGYTSQQQDIVEKENKVREVFTSTTFDKSLPYEISDPYVNCIKLDSNEVINAEPLNSEETQQSLLFTQYMFPVITVVNMRGFAQRFNEFTKNVFSELNWNNVICAGGAVLACLTDDTTVLDRFKGSDVDLFIYGLDEHNANEKLKEIYNVVSSNVHGDCEIIRSFRAVTIILNYPYRHIQIVLRLYRSPAEVLHGFDVDCCACCYNGSDVYVTPRSLNAIRKRCNFTNPTRRSITYEPRLYKYAQRGFGVLVPQYDLSQIPPDFVPKSKKRIS